jgi:hypothetical protein
MVRLTDGEETDERLSCVLIDLVCMRIQEQDYVMSKDGS